MGQEEKLALDGDFTPQFMDRVEESEFAKFVLGEECRRFLLSDLGKLLVGMAEQNRQEAMEAMIKTPLWRKNRLRDLQFKAAVATQFLGFIQEVLIDAQAAEAMLENTRERT